VSTVNAPIVVAVDGSNLALEGVRWAASAAARENRALQVVSVVEPEPLQYGSAIALAQAYTDASRAFAEGALQIARDLVREVAPEVEESGEVLSGRPAHVLREVSQRAHLLVVGRRGLGGVEGLVLGSVSSDLAANSACPLVVVPEGARTDGPVVVGVDGSPVSTAAIAAAFSAAALLGVPLVAVHTYDAHPRFSFREHGEDWEQRVVDEARESLGSQLAGGQADNPDVPVETVVGTGGAAGEILGAAREAQLVVVGSRGRGELSGALLGSTSRSVLHGADCAVMIVRD